MPSRTDTVSVILILMSVYLLVLLIKDDVYIKLIMWTVEMFFCVFVFFFFGDVILH